MLNAQPKVDIELISLLGITELKVGALVGFVQAGSDYAARLEQKKKELIELYEKVKP